MQSEEKEDQDDKPREVRVNWMRRVFFLLRFVPGIGRLRSLRPGSDAILGRLIDAFSAFAMVDQRLSAEEVDSVLDLLRSAFPEVDHGWLARRLQRSIRSPQSLQRIAWDLRDRLDEPGKLALGLQLWTLVDAAGRSTRSRVEFEDFMEQLNAADVGQQILREMASGADVETPLSYERVTFGQRQPCDVVLPPQASEHEFRVYRVGDLVLVRNTGLQPLWVRGRSLESGAFLRMRERQALVVPGWTLMHEDFVHFLNVKKTGVAPRMHLSASEKGLTVDRARTRQSLAVVRFGLMVEVEAHRNSDLQIGSQPLPPVGAVARCCHHERLVDPDGATITLEELRRKALEAGGRFRVDNERRAFLVSNDPAEIGRGDLLISTGLAPRVVLEMRIVPEEGCGYVKVIETEGTVQVNEQVLRGETRVEEGGLIRLSPRQALRCRFSERLIDEERNVIETLKVSGLTHDFAVDARAIDNVSFSMNRGEMMCIIGPSGSGKSTLLAILSGQLQPMRGEVALNDVSLYEHRQTLVPYIARMAQEEALAPQLTVREHFRHAASIRRPSQSAAERERRIDIVLAELGLQGLSHRRVGSAGEKALSGGERSRLNLGLDLLSSAEVFLFDEPISGLSSKDSEHVAETLRALARDKIVIASLHRPGAQVLRLFDRVLLLDSGGRLAFFGTPREMMDYFRLACEELGISHPAIASQQPLGADFVFDVLETPFYPIGGGQNPLAMRRFPSMFWQERYDSEELMQSLHRQVEIPASELPAAAPNLFPRRRRRRVREVFAVFATHFQRALLSKLRARGTVYSTLLEAPLLAALIGITLRSSAEGPYEFSTALHIPAYLFLSATVAMFLGLTNSATEILRDRPVLRRERNCEAGAGLYVTAKFLALALVGALQCLAYLVVANPILDIQGMLLEHWMWMTLTAWAGTAMALLVSSVVKTERAALTAVPLLLVPQMLLAGALVPFREMNRVLFQDIELHRDRGGAPIPAQLMPLRYAYESLVVAQATRNPFERERLRVQRRIEQLKEMPELNKESAQRLEVLKLGLTKLLGAGAINAEQAAQLAYDISRTARRGTMEACEAIEAWPEQQLRAKTVADYFVNSRIDLITREAETFRTDYRNEPGHSRSVFLALKQPLWGEDWWETDQRNGLVLGIFIVMCPVFTGWIITRQKRRVN